jgi:hypothetical protein
MKLTPSIYKKLLLSYGTNSKEKRNNKKVFAT